MSARILRACSAPFLLIALSLFLAGCGNSHNIACVVPASGSCTCGPCPISNAEFLFATTSTGQVLSSAIDHSSGALGSPASVAGPTMSLGLAAAGSQFLYASDFQTAQLYGYSINASSGVLTPINGSPFSTGVLSLPAGLATTPTGKFLYAMDVSKVDAFGINATSGVPTATSGSPFFSGTGLQGVVSPSGQFLFQTDVDPPNGVFAFTIDATTGALTDVPGSPFPVPNQTVLNSTPFAIAIDPSGKFVYEALTFTDQIAAWSVNQTTGVLTPVPGSPFTTGITPIFLTSVKNFLYTMTGGAVYAYTIDPGSGVLTPVTGSPFSVPATAGLVIDSSGTHLYCAAAASNGIFAFTIAADGSLTPLAGSPFPATGPVLLTIVQMPTQGE